MRSRRLPEAHLAIIEEQKITHYLLAGSHPAGGAKATSFRQFGFSAPAWQALRDALLDHAGSARIVSIEETEFGKEAYPGRAVVCAGRPPAAGSNDLVRGERRDGPRLATAYAARI